MMNNDNLSANKLALTMHQIARHSRLIKWVKTYSQKIKK